MKQLYSLYECSDKATRMILHSRFPTLALPTQIWGKMWLQKKFFVFKSDGKGFFEEKT